MKSVLQFIFGFLIAGSYERQEQTSRAEAELQLRHSAAEAQRSFHPAQPRSRR